MPTGYTAELMEKGMEFKPFVLQCARAFGALVMMRDDPMDAPIPEKFEPGDYHVKKLADAVEKHGHLQGMPNSEKIAFGEREREITVKRQKEYLEKKKAQNARLCEMRSQVESWIPPTHDHEGLKAFMLDQIKISMNDTSYTEKAIAEAEGKSPMAFYVEALSRAAWDIDYHKKENAAEMERATKRTEWVRKLRGSL